MSKHSKYYGVGRTVRLREDPSISGRIIGGSHVQDRYLVMWQWGVPERYQALHSRTALLPAEKR